MNHLKVKIFKNFISKKESNELHEWVVSQKELTLWNTQYYIAGYRFFDPANKEWPVDDIGRKLNPISNINENFIKLRNKISNKIKLKNEKKSKNSASLVSIIYEKGFGASHTDSTIDGCIHLRGNIILNCPKNSANVIIDKKQYQLDKGDLIVFPANILEHSTTIHNSKEPRTILSYPFLI